VKKSCKTNRPISETLQGYYTGLIGNRIRAFDWYQNQWPRMTLNNRNAFLWKNRFTEPTRRIRMKVPICWLAVVWHWQFFSRALARWQQQCSTVSTFKNSKFGLCKLQLLYSKCLGFVLWFQILLKLVSSRNVSLADWLFNGFLLTALYRTPCPEKVSTVL